MKFEGVTKLEGVGLWVLLFGFRFQVSGFRFQVSGFGFQVSGFKGLEAYWLGGLRRELVKDSQKILVAGTSGRDGINDRRFGHVFYFYARRYLPATVKKDDRLYVGIIV